jgi:single-stranded DNA-binding protein
MALHTQESLSGFIASDPQLTYTERGDARLYVKIGQEHYRREEDGSFTQTETTFHDLVAFKKTAERAHDRLAKGDKFVAEGYVREYDRDHAGRRGGQGRGVRGEEARPRPRPHPLRGQADPPPARRHARSRGAVRRCRGAPRGPQRRTGARTLTGGDHDERERQRRAGPG